MTKWICRDAMQKERSKGRDDLSHECLSTITGVPALSGKTIQNLQNLDITHNKIFCRTVHYCACIIVNCEEFKVRRWLTLV